MKLKSIKIENYKSFAEENNTLILEDLNTIIGKNESGKSNLIECLSGISLSGINDESFFQKFNKNTGKHPIISVILIPTKEEEKKYKIVGETKITLNGQYDVDIEGGFSDLIKNNEIFQENKKSLNELNKNIVNSFYNQDERNGFNNIIKMINESEKKMFLNYTYVMNITEKIYNNSNYSEFSEYLKKCISYLGEIQEILPHFIEVKDYSLKSKYTKSYLEDSSKSKEMLKHLLNCMDMKLDDLIEYWDISNGGDKLNFSEEFNEKLEKIIAEFNKFYTQEKVEMKAKFENDSLNFAIKTTKKYMDFEERSNGLKWYLNMFIQIMSETNSTDIENYIILIDEPGVYLHINAQKEVLKLFEDFATKNNQIIYTTHSPFMIETDKLNKVRTVFEKKDGTTILDSVQEKDPNTLFPLQAALGYDLAQNLFVSKKNLLVEGISDLTYLSIISTILEENGREGLNSEVMIVPVGGADKVATFISLLRGNKLELVCLLDTFTDQSAQSRLNNMVAKQIIKENKILFYHDVI